MLARVRHESALQELLAIVREFEIPYRILGLGSNVLLPDEGLRGVTILMEGKFQEMSFDGLFVTAGAGLPLARVAKAAVDRGLAGLEALAGFPSTVGGAVVMNAGCYGVEVRDLLEVATVMDASGIRRDLQVEDLSAGYRTTKLQGSDLVVTRAVLRLTADDSGAARERLQQINRRRRQVMPSGMPNAGSVFKNPHGDHAGRLIDVCDLKGTRSGEAEISAVHANVIVNRGGATALEVLDLMRIMHSSVLEKFGIFLEPELLLWGDLRQRWRQLVGRAAAS